MTATVITDSSTALIRGEWNQLAQAVEAFKPSVIVLIARKAPRVWQRLGLAIEGASVVVSDAAVPYLGRYLDNARVAVIDDIVNVGTTMARAIRLCEEQGAREVRAFAIARVAAASASAKDRVDATYVAGQSLDRAGLHEFANRIPIALRGLARPYDLDFPIIECALAMPYANFDQLAAAMGALYDSDRIYDLTTPDGYDSGVRRLAIDMGAGEDGAHYKIRLFFDESTSSVFVMPIRVAAVLDPEAPPHGDALIDSLWRGLSAELPSGHTDARARLRLFLDALSYGRDFVAYNTDLLSPIGTSPFRIEDAELMFGPRVRQIAVRSTRFAVQSRHEPLASSPDATATGLVPSRFLAEATSSGLIEAVRRRALSNDFLSMFISLFEELADQVGANDPDSRRFNGSYADSALVADPYLRLRIGPTVNDTVHIIHHLCGRSKTFEHTRRCVTRLFDRFIDDGTVVPTTAEHDGVITRIYRKGEGGARVEAADRLLYAWQCYERPLSLTRATKLATILAFSQTQDSTTGIKAQERGNTYAFSASLLDEDTEVVHYLRRTNRIVRARSSSQPEAS